MNSHPIKKTKFISLIAVGAFALSRLAFAADDTMSMNEMDKDKQENTESIGAQEPAKDKQQKKMDRRQERRGGDGFLNDLSPEERQQFEEFKNRTKDMTPEQRKEEASKIPFLKDRMQKKEGNGGGGGGAGGQPQQNGPPAHIKQWMENLSPEQKQTLQDFRKSIKDKSPEEQNAARKQFWSEHPDLKPPEAPKNGAMQGQGQGHGQGNQKTGASENSGPGNGHGNGEHMGMDQLSPEQRKTVQEFRSKLKDMSPEEKKEAIQKFRSEHPDIKLPEKHRGGPGGGGGGGGGQGGDMDKDKDQSGKGDSADNVRQQLRQKMESLSPEERKQLQEFRARAKEMSPEERRAEAEKLPVLKDLTPQQRAMLEHRYKQLQQMPPDRKERVMKNFDKWKNMTPEQKEELRKRLRDRKRDGTPGASPDSQQTVNT